MWERRWPKTTPDPFLTNSAAPAGEGVLAGADGVHGIAVLVTQELDAGHVVDRLGRLPGRWRRPWPGRYTVAVVLAGMVTFSRNPSGPGSTG